MEDLSLHVLDIAENSIHAGARNITITIEENLQAKRLTIVVQDDGRGMSAQILATVTNQPASKGPSRRRGMGLPLLKQAAESTQGKLEIRSVPASGTTVVATFLSNHIDMKPLGNMAETITALLANENEVSVLYRHSRGGKTIMFDSKHAESQLGDILLNSIEALSLVRNYLEQEESSLAS